MNKNDLIQRLTELTDFDKKTVKTNLDALLSTVSETLAKGDSIVIPGFGTFTTKNRAARTGRNPQTGAAIQIAAARVPHFKAGNQLKASVAEDAANEE